MAEIEVNGNKKEVPDGEQLLEYAKEAGVSFGCRNGMCMTCLSEIIEGMENLNERTEAEEELGLREDQRLVCQCKIKKGFVKLRY